MDKRPHVKILILYEDKFLIIRDEHEQYTIPGGKVEAGETFLDAARREVKEEVGIEIFDLNIVSNYDLNIYKGDKLVVLFDVAFIVAHCATDKFKLDPAEVKEAHWVTLSGMSKDVVNYDIITKYFNKTIKKIEEPKNIYIREK